VLILTDAGKGAHILAKDSSWWSEVALSITPDSAKSGKSEGNFCDISRILAAIIPAYRARCASKPELASMCMPRLLNHLRIAVSGLAFMAYLTVSPNCTSRPSISFAWSTRVDSS
jgi:hypothetical protein